MRNMHQEGVQAVPTHALEHGMQHWSGQAGGAVLLQTVCFANAGRYGFAESYNPNDRLLIPKASMRAAAGGREPSQALAE